MKKYKAIHKVSGWIESTSVSEILSDILIDLDDIITVVSINGDATKVFIRFEKNDEVRSIDLNAFNLIFEEIK